MRPSSAVSSKTPPICHSWEQAAARRPARPGRQGARSADEEREQEQIARRRQTKPHHHRVDGRDRRGERFDDEQKFSFVEDIRQRSCRYGEQTNRQRARRLHQRHDQRIGIEARHEPAGCGALHPVADIGHERRRPDHGKRGCGGRAQRRALSDAKQDQRCSYHDIAGTAADAVVHAFDVTGAATIGFASRLCEEGDVSKTGRLHAEGQGEWHHHKL